MRRRSFLADVGLAALTTGLAGCSSGFTRNRPEGTGITLRMTMWSSDPGQLAVFDEIADEFTADHDAVTIIEFESLTLDQLDMVLTTGMTADDAPDLTWLPVESSLEYMDAGALLDARPVLSSTAGYDLDDLVPDLQEPWRRGDAQYGVPFSTGPFIMYFNKDLYAEAGVKSPAELLAEDDWTWEAFRQTSKQLTEATGLPGYVVNDFEFQNWTRLLPIMNAYDASPWDEDATRCTADSPEMREALGVFHTMVFEDGSSPVPGQQVDFWGGQAGATSAFLGASSLLEGATFDWDIVPTPGGPAGDVQAVGQSAIVALAAGKNHDAALEFLAFLTNRENARRISEFFPPARESLLNAEVLAESSGLLTAPDLEPIVESITRRGRIFPVAPNGARVANALDSSFDEFVYRPDADLDEALPKVCHAIDPVLSA
ncbi:ABC transporter substrate-binding protein [Brachybacterium sacelli]|uniref:Multiple sugar transport system substrate-binding protein n=1 Tax=Brachybacterium sacelli TaxID=173364 RepID=A0ABS4WYZ3_9MICO|nr:extracellular solute-binding protein [Brachybacterium sacelli]MBP2381432.1 multiple sugar transport system substrate-binding protein [Brachybacterium sacelli]